MRRAITILALLLGVVLGYTAAIVAATPTAREPADTPLPLPLQEVDAKLPSTQQPVAAGAPTVSSSAAIAPTTTPEPILQTYLVWSTGGLTEQLVAGLVAGFDEVSIVKGDVVELEAEQGATIPLDALAIDPAAHRPFDPDGSLASLRPGGIVLGATSAELRRAAVGEELMLAGNPYEIVGIVPDESVSGAEVVFSLADPSLPIATDRFALVAADSARPEFEMAVRSLYEGPAALRIRAAGETPWLRHGDGVLPQVFIKQALGEFTYTTESGSEFTQDTAFTGERIVATDVPILGRIECHEVVAEMLHGAMSQLLADGLAHLVDPVGFAGCWNPRFIRSASGAPSGVSRHSWGAAVDLNARSNPIGSLGTQDPRLVEIMIEWGFTWGGDWLFPDPMHFEYGIDPG